MLPTRPNMTAFVFLHGFAQTPRSWDAVARALQDARHRTYVLDLYGAALEAPSADEGAESGPSSVPGDSLASLGAVCDHVAATVRTVAAVEGAPVLVGYSMGGRIAAETVVRHPDLPLAGLVLESAGLGPADEATRAALAQRNGEWAARLRREGVEAFMDWWETLPLFASQRELPAPVREAVRAERCAHDAEALALSLERWGAHEQAAESETLAALEYARDQALPVLYAAGAKDAKYVAVAERVRAAGVPVALVKGAGHNVHLEQPEAFAALLREKLALLA